MQMFRAVSLISVALAATVACSKPAANGSKPTTTQPQAKGEGAADVMLDPSLTVASVNGSPITAAQLDEKIKPQFDQATQEYTEKIHEARRETLESMVVEQLVKTEAKARGVTEDALVQAEIREKAEKPSEEELKSAYDRFVKGQYDVTFEDAKGQLAQQVGREKEAVRARAFFEELKQKYKVTTSLPLPKVRRVEVAATGAAKGPDDAKVTIVEFSDFECPFCSRVNPTVDEVMKQYAGKVRLVFRHYPLPMHANAPKASEASLCAHDQGKFWEMHDQLFANQTALTVPQLKEHAKTIGLDQAKFDACLDGGTKGEIVTKDTKEGQAAGVNGTPAFFINGRLISGAQPITAFKEVIDAELAN